ncbi:MAG: ABC transporter ATP-binding protein/permease [Candidatus Vogelbacteria bacterium]|nr:ABC transporter ATP-binding protein/permease [Candidatus Vogelbacteria bacterium]
MKNKKLSKDDYLTGFRTVFKYLNAHQADIKLLGLLTIVLSIGNPLIPWITGKLFDSIAKDGGLTWLEISISWVYIWLIFWFVTQLSIYSIDSLTSRKKNILAHKLYGDYVTQGYNHLLLVPLEFHKNKKMGAIMNAINRSASYLQDISSRVVVDLAPQFISIIITVIFTLSISSKLSLIMFVGVIIYIIVLTQTIDQSANLQRKIQRKWNVAWRHGYDSVENITTVKQTTSEDYAEKKNLKNFLIGAIQTNIAQTLLLTRIYWYQRMIILGTQLSIFIISIWLIKSGGMTLGQLITITSYTGMIFAPFIALGEQWRTIQNGFISLEESEKTMTYPEENYTPADHVSLVNIDGKIEFKDVSFAYEANRMVLKNINLQINPGEVVALVGKSGEGKSTLIDLLSGYHFAKKGQVLVDGIDVKKLDLKFLRSQIGVVPQEVVLFSDTIETNIKYGNFKATQKQVAEAARKAHALEFIEKFPKKWKQVVGERGVKLSVGQKQRVAIARAILRNPRILILDEPTSALDAESENFITKSLEELMSGRTTFIIAHRLSTVRRADKILVFKEGQIVETGTHDELAAKENGVYRNLYELQTGLHA